MENRKSVLDLQNEVDECNELKEYNEHKEYIIKRFLLTSVPRIQYPISGGFG